MAVKEEGDVTRAAATQYDLGDLAMLRFDAQSALPHYEKAFRYRPDNPRYAEAMPEHRIRNETMPRPSEDGLSPSR